MIHARLSPSGADRFMTCTASVRLIEMLIARGEIRESDLEDEVKEQITEEEIFEQNIDGYSDAVLDAGRESTSFSAEGTVLHTVRSNCLVFGDEPHDYVGRVMGADGFSFQIDDDMADRLTAGIDWIRETTDYPIVEERVSLDPWLPGQHGFCDTFWLVPVASKKHAPPPYDLYVSDYKNGVGVPVEVVGTRQLRLYALGAWHALGRPNIRKVILNIDQPRAGGMKFWEITLDELLEFGDEARRVYERIERGDVEFVPTKKGCRFCPVRKTKRGCAAYNKWHLQMIGLAILDPSEPEPKFVDPDQMPRALRFYVVQHAPEIRAWLAKLHEESLNAAIQGDPDPGSKAVKTGEGTRFLSDTAEAEKILVKALGDQAFKPKKLIGFTEIDSIMKPGRKKQGHPQAYADLLALVDRTEPKPKLVPADHPAPAFTHMEQGDYDDLDAEEFEDFDADEL